MKVLATRRYPGPAFEELKDVEVGSPSNLHAPRPDVEALLVANEPVPLELLPGLRIVANFGVGYDRLDVAALGRRGIAVTNTPGVLSAATADLTFALILAVRRRVVEGDRAVRAGAWTGSWADGFLAEELTTGQQDGRDDEFRARFFAVQCQRFAAEESVPQPGRRLPLWNSREE